MFIAGASGEEPTYNEGDVASIPGLRRPPGGGQGNTLQRSCLEKPMGRGAWRVLQPVATGSDTAEGLSGPSRSQQIPWDAGPSPVPGSWSRLKVTYC